MVSRAAAGKMQPRILQPPSIAQYHNITIIPQYLDEQAAVHSNAGGAVVVQPPAVAPPLIGVQVHTAGFGRRAAY